MIFILIRSGEFPCSENKHASPSDDFTTSLSAEANLPTESEMALTEYPDETTGLLRQT